MRRVQNPTRMPLFSLSSFLRLARSNPRTNRTFRANAEELSKRAFAAPIALPINNFPLTDIMSSVYCARSFIAP